MNYLILIFRHRIRHRNSQANRDGQNGEGKEKNSYPRFTKLWVRIDEAVWVLVFELTRHRIGYWSTERFRLSSTLLFSVRNHRDGFVGPQERIKVGWSSCHHHWLFWDLNPQSWILNTLTTKGAFSLQQASDYPWAKCARQTSNPSGMEWKRPVPIGTGRCQTPKRLSPRDKMSPIGVGRRTHQPIKWGCTGKRSNL